MNNNNQERSSAQVVPFSFEKHTVRTVVIDGEPWFVAKDVAEILGYQNPSEAVRAHCKRVEILKASKSLVLKVPPRGLQIIPEPDLYRLITRSTLESAERFEAWVYEEVLPTIRKTGSYSVAPPLTREEQLAQACLLANQVIAEKDEKIGLLTEHNHRLSLENHEVKETLKEAKPKADFADAVSASEGSLNLTETAKILGMKPRLFTQTLRAEGIIYKAKGNNLPIQRYINRGYFEVVSVVDDKGFLRRQTRVTGDGQYWLWVRYGCPVPTK